MRVPALLGGLACIRALGAEGSRRDALLRLSGHGLRQDALELPNPREFPRKCGRRDGRPSHICDPEGLLPAELLDAEDVQLATLKTAITHGWPAPPSCEKDGWQLYVAVVNQLDRRYLRHASLEDSARAFLLDIGREWNVLDTSCRNGIMMLYAVKDEYATVLTDDGPAATLLPGDLTRHVVHNSMRSFLRAPSKEAVFVNLIGNIEGILEGYDDARALNWRRSLAFVAVLCSCFGLTLVGLASCLVYDAYGQSRHSHRIELCKRTISRTNTLLLNPQQGPLAESCPICGGRGRRSWRKCFVCAPPGQAPGVRPARVPLETSKRVLERLCDQFPDVIDKREVERWAYMGLEDWAGELGNPPYRSVFQPRGE